MGLLDKAKALANKGEQAVDKIVNATEEATKTVVNEARDTVDEVVQESRKDAGEVAAESRKVVSTIAAEGHGAADAIANELRKARGIISGDIDGFVHPSSPYAERLLTGAEKDLARQVFEETLPYGTIYLSNGLGLGRRAYTIPHPLHLGSYVIHIGPETFPDATDSSIVIFGQTADAVFIHELTHVWQGVNRSTPFDYIADSVYHQIRSGSHAYDLDPADVGKKSWGKFNAEQQAMIVENWYVGGMSESDDAFTYIKDNIRARNA
jgi:polyhydroxyalkanoate synthesis regulator phasin